MLQHLHPLSVKGSLLLVKMLIYRGDIAESFGGTAEESCDSYRKAETILHEQVRTNAEFYNNAIHTFGFNLVLICTVQNHRIKTFYFVRFLALISTVSAPNLYELARIFTCHITCYLLKPSCDLVVPKSRELIHPARHKLYLTLCHS